MPATSRGTLLLATLLALWAVGGYVFHNVELWRGERDYRLLVDLINRKAELAEEVPSPRILIAGGSNAYYGIDTHILEARLGMPAVNVALPFGAHHMSINFALLKRIVRPGDIVVFADAGFWKGPPKSAARIRRVYGFDSYLVATNFPGYTRRFDTLDLPWQPLPGTSSLALELIERPWRAEARSWLSDTDDDGNYTGCVPLPIVTPETFLGGRPDGATVALFRSAAAAFEESGVRLVVNLPWMFILERDREAWTRFRARFVASYGTFAHVIAEEPSVVLRSERDHFCDSPFHLSTKATRQRSENIAAALEAYLAHPKAEKVTLRRR